MKKLLLIALLIVGAFAEDELILLNGESIKGEYVKIEDGKIHFIPEGSLASQTIDENRVKELIQYDDNKIKLNKFFVVGLIIVIKFLWFPPEFTVGWF